MAAKKNTYWMYPKKHSKGVTNTNTKKDYTPRNMIEAPEWCYLTPRGKENTINILHYAIRNPKKLNEFINKYNWLDKKQVFEMLEKACFENVSHLFRLEELIDVACECSGDDWFKFSRDDGYFELDDDKQQQWLQETWANNKHLLLGGITIIDLDKSKLPEDKGSASANYESDKKAKIFPKVDLSWGVIESRIKGDGFDNIYLLSMFKKNNHKAIGGFLIRGRINLDDIKTVLDRALEERIFNKEQIEEHVENIGNSLWGVLGGMWKKQLYKKFS